MPRKACHPSCPSRIHPAVIAAVFRSMMLCSPYLLTELVRLEELFAADVHGLVADEGRLPRSVPPTSRGA